MDHLINQIRISRIAAGDLHAWRQLPLILGSIALLSCTCLYLAVPCGALAVIFATLSRGGMMSYTSKAQIGMILGIIALIATIVLYASVLGYAIHQYGSIDGFLKAYSDMQGMDYNELMKQFMAK